MRGRGGIFLTAVFLISLPVAPTAAESAVPAGPAPAAGVLGSVEAAPGADPSLRDVVLTALDLQFMRRNAPFASVSLGSPGGEAETQGLRQAAERHQQFLLLGVYSTSARDMTFTVQLYDARTGARIRSAAVSGRIGLALDSLVARALDNVLSGLTLQSAPQPTAPAETGDKPVPIAPGTDQASRPEPLQPAEPGVSAVPAAPALPDNRPAGRPTSLAMSTGAAPFIPLGRGTYANLGVLGTFSAVYRFPVGPGIVGAGILAGVGTMKATGAVASAGLLVVPVGAELSYSMNEGGFPGILFHLSGGPAVLSASTSYEGTLTKAVPYLIAGMRVDAPFTSYLGMSVEAAWAGFFESTSVLIMGFAPGVSLYARF